MSTTPTQPNDRFSDLISNAVAERMQPDFIEKAILDRVDKLVDSAIDDALRSYSDTGKLISKAVQDALQVNDLDLPSYGETVTRILRQQIEAQVSELVAGRLAADMQELLSLAPKKINLSEIVRSMTQPHEEDGKYGEVVTCIVEPTGYGSTWIYLDENEAGKGKYQCTIQMLLDKAGVISSATLNGADTSTRKHVGLHYGLSQKIRAYHACGTAITVDEDAVITSIGDC